MFVILALAVLFVTTPAWALDAKAIATTITGQCPDAEFSYQGDGSSLGAHTAANGDKATGLTWIASSTCPTRPTLAEIQAWAAAKPAPEKIADRIEAAKTLNDLKVILKERLK
jgi:hypothetical protein